MTINNRGVLLQKVIFNKKQIFQNIIQHKYWSPIYVHKICTLWKARSVRSKNTRVQFSYCLSNFLLHIFVVTFWLSPVNCLFYTFYFKAQRYISEYIFCRIKANRQFLYPSWTSSLLLRLGIGTFIKITIYKSKSLPL